MTDLLRCALPVDPDPDLAAAADKPFRKHAALSALKKARKNWRDGARSLAAWFRQHKELGSKDRPVVQDAVHGMIRHEHLLLRAGCHDPDALYEGWRRLVAGERFEDLAHTTPAEDYAAALSLGWPVAKEWLAVLGPEGAAALGAALSQRAPVVVRANLLRCTRAQLAERLASEGVPTQAAPQTQAGLVLGARVNVGGLGSFREGWFEVQDTASQRFAEAIPLVPGQEVVDVCAGAGGKSLALAARGAQVRAWDVREDVLRRLAKRAQRAGAPVVVAEPDEADVVVVDAPCSGVGRLRREPTLRWCLEPGAHVQTQRALIQGAAHLVRDGGILAYATCSLLSVENDVPDPEGFVQLDRQVLWPHTSQSDGFGWTIWRQGP